jgi:hypothetical protein
MDAQGARDLARRIESNQRSADRPVAADVPAGTLPLYQWFGGGSAEPATETPPPAKGPSLRRLRPRSG